jgi:putative Holliday junction resolvase
MNLLGIDYGEKHIGLAIAVTSLAEPVVTIEKDMALKRIQELVEEYQIEQLVVGVSEGEMAIKSRRYGEYLSTELGLPVDFIDETLTSNESRLKVAQVGMKKSKREAKIDHYAAAILLQNYMDDKIF